MSRAAQRQRRSIVLAAPAPSGARGGAWLALWALLVQIALPLGQAVPLPMGDAQGPRTLVICAANGALRSMPAPGSGPAQPQSQQGQGCSVCLAYAAGGHLVLPGGAVLPLPPATGEALPTPPFVAFLGGMRTGLPQPRGPPAAVLA